MNFYFHLVIIMNSYQQTNPLIESLQKENEALKIKMEQKEYHINILKNEIKHLKTKSKGYSRYYQ